MSFKPNEMCSCGKVHTAPEIECIIQKDAITNIAKCVKKFNAKKAFLYADINTYPIAGEKIRSLLAKDNIFCTEYIFEEKHLEPDEKAVGSLIMHYDSTCDVIIGLGSGVINDLGKILSKTTGKPYIIVATAPSMDGYASSSSSMAMDGVKVSLNTKCPDVIIGDIDILKTAPVHMIKSGLGDMLAKYTSICEWRISNLINGEYYCENIAEFVRASLKKCVSNAAGILEKNEESIAAVMEGLIGCGTAMDYAGVSRPASGIEHYLSHVWDMRALEFGTPCDLHGIQCAVGSLYSIKSFETLFDITPDVEKGCAYAESFDFEDWGRQLLDFIGHGANAMIQLEEKEQKYNIEKHRARIGVIKENWNRILDIMREELPSSVEFEKILDTIKCPKTVEEIGLDSSILPMTFKSAKDIRDKYVIPRLMWDLGILEEAANNIK